MRRLTIQLKDVEKIDNKVYNTVSHIIKREEDINQFINLHGGPEKINKYYISNMI